MFLCDYLKLRSIVFCWQQGSGAVPLNSGQKKKEIQELGFVFQLEASGIQTTL